MTVNAYTVGALVRLSCIFTVNGIATDPTTTVFKMEKPDGTVVTYTYGTDAALVREAAGRFHVDWQTALQGTHTYRFVGTGTVVTAVEAQFRTNYSPF